MGFFSSSTSSSSGLSKKFKVTSQTQLKRVSKTYWNNQFSKKGIKMKGEEGELEYIKAPGVRTKIAQLLRKRGYVSEASLQKDLIKERVQQQDRKRVLNAMRGKFAKREEGTITPEQIQANVKKARAVDRLMSTKGQSTADKIKHGKEADRIKQEFKSDYSRLGIKGVSYNIGGKDLSTDDPRSSANSNQEGKNAIVGINAAKIKGVTGESKGLADGKKEAGIAAEVGVKQPNKAGSADKTTGSNSKDLSSVSLAPMKKIEKKKEEKILFPSEAGSSFDPEFSGGVLYGNRKLVHLADLINQPEVPKEKKAEAKKPVDTTEAEKEKISAIYVGEDAVIFDRINNYCTNHKFYCQQIRNNILSQLNDIKPNYVFLDANIRDSFQLYFQIKQLGLLNIKKIIMLIAKNENEISKVIDAEIKYYQLKEEFTNEKVAELIK